MARYSKVIHTFRDTVFANRCRRSDRRRGDGGKDNEEQLAEQDATSNK